MNTNSDGQVEVAAARVYEDFFVPALFQEWAPRLVHALDPGTDAQCLDVGCGTGVLARELARRCGPTSVTGLDRNQGMLATAAEALAEVSWLEGRAEALPFESGAFDCVGSQFALMFFDDRIKALQEMWRVLKAGGRLALAVWGPLEETPGYASMVALLDRLFGKEVARELRAPFCLGHVEELRGLLNAAGLPGARISTVIGRARFPSIAQWVQTDIRGWTLADKIDDSQLAVLTQAAQLALASYVTDNRVEFDSPAHLIVVDKAEV